VHGAVYGMAGICEAPVDTYPRIGMVIDSGNQFRHSMA
jgi:hypothetical protein